MTDARQVAIVCRERRQGVSLIALATAGLFAAQTATAQTAPPVPNIVGACSGVSLPRSVVTDILSPVVTGIANPLQGSVNAILGGLGGLLPLVPRSTIDVAGLLADAAAGDAITLQVLNANNTIVGPGDRCDLQADGFSLDTPQGIAIGGNRITGLGATGPAAIAGEGSSIAFGNAAVTADTATGSMALGTQAQVGAGATGAIALGTGAVANAANSVALGAGSIAGRGALAGYLAPGLGVAQTSAGEVSVGTPGAERQITNVAAGINPTDAANVGQVTGLAAQMQALADQSVLYDGTGRASVTLGGGAGGTVLANVTAGALTATSTEAVNGAQLFATDTRVTTNTTAITNLGDRITNGAVGTVQYADAATPTIPNGGVVTGDLALVGAGAGPVGLHNVANGTIAAGSTDAVNGGQLALTDQSVLAAQGTADTALALGNNSVQYGPGRASVVLNAGGAATVLGNVAAGVAPTDAVNVGQLDATNVQVTNNTTAITSITNGGAGTVQYTDAATPTIPNGGIVTGDLALVGAGAGPVGLHNVANGTIAAGSTDAVNGGQVFDLAAVVDNAVAYDADVNGVRTNVVTLAGGDPAAAVTLGNVAAGTVAAGSTEGVNGGQLNTTNQSVLAAQGTADTALLLGNNSVQYGPGRTSVVLNAGGAATVLGNVAAGVAPTDAVNVGQLAATDAQVTVNTIAITNLGGQVTNVVNGGAGTVQYVNAATPTTPNGGVPSNDVALVGATAAPVGLHNVAAGSIAAGSTDAVNGGQVFGLAATVANAVAYDVDANGVRTNAVTLAGADPAAAVTIGNLAPGTVAAGSTQAVNGSQLNTTNLAVTAAQGTADTALLLGNNSVQYGPGRANVVFNAGGAATVLGNVAAGVAPTDAVNVGQLTATSTQVTTNTNAIVSLTNGGAGTVQYANAATPTTPNGGIASNDLTLVGATAAPVGLHNVANGTIAAGSTDAVNGGQVFGLAATVANAVAYDTDANGVRTNAITLAGGDPAAPVTIANVAAGTVAAGSTEGVNGGQLATTNLGVAAAQGTANTALTLGANSVQYGPGRTNVTFNAGGAATVLGNVAAGVAPTDAVNAGQLGATNAQVATNTTAITSLGDRITTIANGAAGPVQYASAATPTTPNGGVRSNDVTLVGATAGPVGLHNVAAGSLTAGSADAVTGGQVYNLAITAVNAVAYDADANGVRTNTVTLAGGNAAAPVTIANVAAGTVAAGSTQAVNGAQLATTNQNVAAAQGTANSALTLGGNSVQYGPTRTNVTFNNGGAATVLSNVGAGTSATDAANVGQMNAGIAGAITQSNAYTDGRIAALNFDLRKVRRDSHAGTSGALAAAGLPQAYEAGKGMIAMGGGTYGGQSAFAIGFSRAFEDGHVVARLSGTYDSGGRAGASGGVGYQF